MKELTLQELRVLGGKALLKKYGRSHFAEMGKKGALRRKELKNTLKGRIKTSIKKLIS